MGLEKLRLEAAIMGKAEAGEEHTGEWKQLMVLRADIDNLAEEKL